MEERLFQKALPWGIWRSSVLRAAFFSSPFSGGIHQHVMWNVNIFLRDLFCKMVEALALNFLP